MPNKFKRYQELAQIFSHFVIKKWHIPNVSVLYIGDIKTQCKDIQPLLSLWLRSLSANVRGSTSLIYPWRLYAGVWEQPASLGVRTVLSKYDQTKSVLWKIVFGVKYQDVSYYIVLYLLTLFIIVNQPTTLTPILAPIKFW